MSWKQIAEINLTSNWQFSDYTDKTLFRLKHNSNSSKRSTFRAALAQVLDENELTIYEGRIITFKEEAEGSTFTYLPMLPFRKLAIKRIDELTEPWTVIIEENTMPLTNSVQPLVFPTAKSKGHKIRNVDRAAGQAFLLAGADENRTGLTICNLTSEGRLIIACSDNPIDVENVQVSVVISSNFGYYEVPYGYTGQIQAMFLGVNGTATVTEFFAESVSQDSNFTA